MFHQFCFLSNSLGLTSTSRTESSPASQGTTATVPSVNTTATHSSQTHSPSYVPAITTVQSLSLTTLSLSLSFTPRSRNYSATTAVEISRSQTLLTDTGSVVDLSTTPSLELTHISKETSLKSSINSTQQSRVSLTAANFFKGKCKLQKCCPYEVQGVLMPPFSIHGEIEKKHICCRSLTHKRGLEYRSTQMLS